MNEKFKINTPKNIILSTEPVKALEKGLLYAMEAMRIV
jgi:hypothetical protein